jgi:molecular chaperone DnaJ
MSAVAKLLLWLFNLPSFQILKDEKKRATFDQYGSASQSPGFNPNAFAGAAGFGRTGGFSGGFSGFQFESQGGDLFEQLFGSFAGAGGRSRPTTNARGDDVETSLTISFLEACKGTKKKVTITPVADCTTCSATGLKEGVQRKSCSACNGSGTRTFVIDGGFHMASTCNVCAGVGSTVPPSGECPSCRGVGKVRTKESITVDIPAGT